MYRTRWKDFLEWGVNKCDEKEAVGIEEDKRGKGQEGSESSKPLAAG